MTRNHAEALTCFHRALSLNPNCEHARDGLEQLEHLMRRQNGRVDAEADLEDDDETYRDTDM
eukprot:CAMPEP_0184039056 /NCGR_PEP_ID=MMETSP0955-20130417/50444_1 /TAXON_ID=627963 /ORGANISM="Aplanochytrium sp, Strain PBS07" /LENGTH=61 /DNA_ID=CAMNT_0026328009 /DNA_START=139 /DNA_END=324 /DNA_ORIENTATION=+